MQTDGWVVVGLDNGGNKNNATVLDASGRFLVDELLESPSRVTEGPDVAIEALVLSFEDVLRADRHRARARPRRSASTRPGPASAEGVISARGSTNFAHPGWRNFDFRGAPRGAPGACPSSTTTTATPPRSTRTTSSSGRSRRSARRSPRSSAPASAAASSRRARSSRARPASRASSATCTSRCTACSSPGQPLPHCNCGFDGDAESVASLTGIEKNLLPYWLTRYPDHELAKAESLAKAAKLVRAYGENGDPMALAHLRAAGEGGGPAVHDRRQLHRPRRLLRRRRGRRGRAPLPRVVPRQGAREHARSRRSRRAVARFEVVPDLDMAGARGAAIAALERIHAR